MACSVAAVLSSGMPSSYSSGQSVKPVGAKRVGPRLDFGGALPVLTPEPRPLVGIVSPLVDVPARASGMPDGARERGAQLVVEGFRRLPADLDLRASTALELAQRGDHVRDAGFNRVD